MSEWRNIAHHPMPDYPVEVFKSNGQIEYGIRNNATSGPVTGGIFVVERKGDKLVRDGCTFHMKVIAWREIEKLPAKLKEGT